MTIHGLQIIGWGVKLCDHSTCNEDDCSNIENSIYYIDKDWLQIIAEKCQKTPLVLNHSKFIIGYVDFCEYQLNKGLYISCIIDDYDFLTFIHDAFVTYMQKKKNKAVTFKDWLKSIFSAYSISNRQIDFEHVSLVMTPGRKGTNVSYIDMPQISLISRPNNSNIRNHIFGYASIYLSESDRKKYLSVCNKSSLLPNDYHFLRAERSLNMQSEQSLTTVENLQNDTESANVSPSISPGDLSKDYHELSHDNITQNQIDNVAKFKSIEDNAFPVLHNNQNGMEVESSQESTNSSMLQLPESSNAIEITPITTVTTSITDRQLYPLDDKKENSPLSENQPKHLFDNPNINEQEKSKFINIEPEQSRKRPYDEAFQKDNKRLEERMRETEDALKQLTGTMLNIQEMFKKNIQAPPVVKYVQPNSFPVPNSSPTTNPKEVLPVNNMDPPVRSYSYKQENSLKTQSPSGLKNILKEQISNLKDNFSNDF